MLVLIQGFFVFVYCIWTYICMYIMSHLLCLDDDGFLCVVGVKDELYVCLETGFTLSTSRAVCSRCRGKFWDDVADVHYLVQQPDSHLFASNSGTCQVYPSYLY